MMIKIFVRSLEEKNKPAEPDIIAKAELDFASMVILEQGTASGDTSVSFRLTDDQGNDYIAQMTGNMFRACCSAFKGGDERFKNKE